METISKVLFWIANSLLIPDIIILIRLFIRSLLLIGSFYNQFVTKLKNDKLLNDAIKNTAKDGIEPLKNLLPEKNNSLFVKHLRDLLYHPIHPAY